VVVSNIFYFHPYLGKISNLTNIFRWVETTNQLWFEFGRFSGRTLAVFVFVYHLKVENSEKTSHAFGAEIQTHFCCFCRLMCLMVCTSVVSIKPLP